MSALSLYPTYQYSNGEVGTPAVFNNPLIALQAWSTTIDRSNMTTGAGIDASNLTPSTLAAATFGGTSGYLHLAPAANVTPLTISSVSAASANTLVVNMGATQSVAGLLVNGAASITGNIFEVDLTAGGTKAVFVNSGGAFVFGGLNSALPSGPSISGTASGGLVLNATASQPIFFTTGVAGITTVAEFTANGVFQLGNFGGPGLTSAPQLVGGSSGALILNTTTGQNFLFTTAGSTVANINSSTGTYTATSDSRLKENVTDLQLGLADVLKLRPVSFDWIASKLPGQGFLAQDVQAIIPLAVSNVGDESDDQDKLGIADALLTPVVIKAFQQFYAEFTAYKMAHP